MTQPPIMYYRARPDLTVNDLPIFFGRIELRQDRISGRHYRARIDKDQQTYIIGYYWIDQPADQFFNKFAAHGDLEITQVEFETLLDHWTQGGQIPPLCWNPEQS